MSDSVVDNLIKNFLENNPASYSGNDISALAKSIIDIERSEGRESIEDLNKLRGEIKNLVFAKNGVKINLDNFNSNIGTIKFNQILISKFGPYEKQTIIDFPDDEKSLVMIIGGTGQGKTSIFNALSWVFTKTAKRK